MEIILRGKKEEKFIVDERVANLIKNIIQQEKQNESLEFMLQNAGKLKDLTLKEEDIYMQGDK